MAESVASRGFQQSYCRAQQSCCCRALQIFYCVWVGESYSSFYLRPYTRQAVCPPFVHAWCHCVIADLRLLSRPLSLFFLYARSQDLCLENEVIIMSTVPAMGRLIVLVVIVPLVAGGNVTKQKALRGGGDALKVGTCNILLPVPPELCRRECPLLLPCDALADWSSRHICTAFLRGGNQI